MSSNRRNSKLSEDDAKPGTSSSMHGAGGSGRRISSGEDENLSEGSSQEPSPSLVKARNASRDRPVPESIETKRLKVSEEDDDDDNENEDHPDGMEVEESEVVRGMPMDTDASEDSDVPGKDNNDPAAREPGSHSHQQPNETVETDKFHSRRSSTADENVSTTMQSSSLRYGSLFTSGGNRESTFVLDQAVASTSAAAMAPPLSRIMEESPALNEVYRHSVVYSPENIADAPSTNQTAGRSASAQGQQLRRNMNETVDVNENQNQGPDMSLHKMHGKQRLMWARKLFFVSTELVFPGFTAYSDNKSKMADYLGVRVRSSCAMQGLLYADTLFFIMWILSFLSTCDILITVLKQLHGYLSICLTCLFILVNAIRLRFGLKGNENDEVQYLALFWMITVIVQIPLFTFIFLTDLFCPVLMAFTVTMDGAMMIFILLESIVGFVHFRSLLRDEMNIVRMAKRSKEARASAAHQRQEEPPRVPQTPVSNPSFEARMNAADQNESDSSNTDSEIDNDPVGANQDGSMDFQMQIRRLSESRRNQDVNENQDDSASDSSEQVTSTSDTIRQRPIRAH